MAQQLRGVTRLNEAAEQLISNEYGLAPYGTVIRNVARMAAEAVIKEQQPGQDINAEILKRGKADLRKLLNRMQKNEIVNGKLGGMQLYQIWDAKQINGNEWLFYPPYTYEANPHVSWVAGQNEVHVKFDTPVTLYYNAQLTFVRVGQYGGQPSPEQRHDAAEILWFWQATMLSQPKLRVAIAEFLS